MKQLLAALLLAFACLTLPVQAATPSTITYQGYLTNSTNTPLNAPVAMTLSLYSAPRGGTALWSEHQAGIAVVDGIYSIQIGSISPINLPFDTIYYLGVAVGSDPEMTPRQELAAVPYAFRASSADSLSQICNDGEVLKYSSASSSWSCAIAAGPQRPEGPVGAAGPVGATGPTGAVGPAGATGSVGATGATGPQGPVAANGTNGAAGINGINGKTVLNGIADPTDQGVDGDFYINTASNMIFGPRNVGIWPVGVSLVGPNGTVGSQGLTGSQGPAGAIGPQGLTGSQGPVGAVGAQGLQGVQGIAGPAGTVGVAGPSGPAGLTGLTGASGPQGSASAVGATGLQGIAGAVGATGLQGIAGAAGATGPQGPQGPTGAAGATGATGPQGIAGLDGRTVLNGTIDPVVSIGVDGDFFINTASNMVFGPKNSGIWPVGISIVGSNGAVGPQGDTGLPGPAGATGLQGPIGPVGAQGSQGIQGVAGTTGSTGATGVAGATGATGLTGAPGPLGLVGATGATGAQGIQGIQGIEGASPFTLSGADAVYNSGSVGIGVTPPDATAVLDVSSTTKGFLAPRMTAAQIALIAAPATGLLVYKTDGPIPGFYYFNGSSWAGPFSTSTGSYLDLTNKPALGAVATRDSIANSDVSVSAAIATSKVSGPISAISGNGLAGVAFSGNYIDLSSKPVAGSDFLVPAGDGSALTGLTKIQVSLGNVENLKVNLAAATDPASTDDVDHGYAIGSRWINTTTSREFVCTNATSAASLWKETTASGALQVTSNLIDLTNASAARSNLGIATVGNTGSYNDLNDKPSLGALASKSLAVLTTDITGTLPLANGGTGSTNGSIAGSGGLTFAAGGSNQNITFTPSGAAGYTQVNGNVGIGGAPSERFHILSGALLGSTPGDYLTLSRSDAQVFPGSNLIVKDFAVRYSTDTGWFSTSYLKGISVDNSFSTPDQLKTWIKQSPAVPSISFGDGGAEWLQINNGNVGIGTAPGFKLDVAGAANISGDIRVGGNFGIGGAPEERFHIRAGLPIGTTAGNYRLLTRVDGVDQNSVRVKDFLVREVGGSDWTTDSYVKGIDADGAFSTPATLRSWIKQWPGNYVIAFGDGGTEWMRINNGKVGIGTKSPGYGLDVVGDVNVSGSFKVGGISLATVASSGSYADLTGKPALSAVATSASYSDLSGKPSFGALAAKNQADLTSDVTGALPVANGGTGSSSGSITGNGALTFSAGGSNSNINLAPTGTGTVDVVSKRITSLATPSNSTDAATKGYVDATVLGGGNTRRTPLQVATLNWHSSFPDISTGSDASSGIFQGDNYYPNNIAFDGTNIWVANKNDNTVTQLRASNGAVVGTYSIGSGPVAVVFDGNCIWVANKDSNTVTKLRSSDGVPEGTFNVGNRPVALTFDGTNIWVANNGDSSVMKLRASDGFIQGTYGSGGSGQGTYDVLYALAFDGTCVWVVDIDRSYLTKLNSDGTVAGYYHITRYPAGLAFDGSYMWVAISENTPTTTPSVVRKINPADGSIVASYPVGITPLGVAFDGTNIWVSNSGGNSGGNTVTKLSASDGSVLSTVAVGIRPSGLVFDGVNVWVNNGNGYSASRR